MTLDPKNKPGSAGHTVFSLSQEVEDLDNTVEALDTTVSGVDSDVSALDTRVDTLEAESAAGLLKQTITMDQAEIAGGNGTIATKGGVALPPNAMPVGIRITIITPVTGGSVSGPDVTAGNQFDTDSFRPGVLGCIVDSFLDDAELHCEILAGTAIDHLIAEIGDD